jgi:hypothetical protein
MVKSGKSTKQNSRTTKGNLKKMPMTTMELHQLNFYIMLVCLVLTIQYFNPTFFPILARNDNLAFLSIASLTLFTYMRINKMGALVILALALAYVYLERNKNAVERFLNDYSNAEMLPGMSNSSTVCTDNSCGNLHQVNKGQLSNSVEHLWYHPANNTLTDNLVEGFSCGCEMCNCDNGCNGSCAGKNCSCNNVMKQSVSGLANALHAQGNYAEIPGMNPAPVSKLAKF